MNANLIFKWLKDPRFAPAEGGSSPEESIALEGVFLPVGIETPALERPTAPAPMTDMAADPGPAVLAQRVDIAAWRNSARGAPSATMDILVSNAYIY